MRTRNFVIFLSSSVKMSLGKTVTYTGEILDCVKQGKGSYKYPGGVYTYEGPW